MAPVCLSPCEHESCHPRSRADTQKVETCPVPFRVQVPPPGHHSSSFLNTPPASPHGSLPGYTEMHRKED